MVEPVLTRMASSRARPTDAGLPRTVLQANNDNAMSHALYAVTLRRDGPNPLPPQSDEVEEGRRRRFRPGRQERQRSKGGKDKSPAGVRVRMTRGHRRPHAALPAATARGAV